MKPKIKLIIFDVGGVLRDSSHAMFEALQSALKASNLPITLELADWLRLRGLARYNNKHNAISAILALQRSGKKLGDVLLKDNAEEELFGLEKTYITREDRDIIGNISNHYSEFFYSDEAGKYVKVNQETKLALMKLAKKYKLAIVTSSRLMSVKRDLRELDLTMFSAIITHEDVRHEKPSGEGILLACKKCNTDPKDAIYAGDAVTDIIASRDAGCIAIGILSGMASRKDIEKANPDYIFKDVAEMVKHFCG